MRIKLDDYKTTVKVNSRNLTAGRRKFSNTFFNNLGMVGLVNECPEVLWQAAAQLISRDF